MGASVTSNELRARTMQFVVRVVKFSQRLPDTWDARRIGGQLIDAGTSVAMNYRGATRGRSRAEFIAKLGVVVEEADECVGWLELIAQIGLPTGPEYVWLLSEATQLTAIFGAAQKTANENRRRETLTLRANRKSPSRRPTITEAPP